ncbi:uncharacterized protein LOC117320931, partial [Pecten maximus]|uniref:uncharacterized protein LOC117320931 n=1 Tax=Pecten maximus TaxID=6579 RepID=UPI0014581CB4
MLRENGILCLLVGLYLCVSAESDGDIIQELNEIKTEMVKLKRSNEMMAEEIQNLKGIVGQKPHTGASRDRRQLQDLAGVAFTAELSSDLHTITRGRPIVYDHILLNHGNGYNRGDGIFVVPLSGVYCFYWNLMTDDSDAFDSNLWSTRGRLGDGYSDQDST